MRWRSLFAVLAFLSFAFGYIFYAFAVATPRALSPFGLGLAGLTFLVITAFWGDETVVLHPRRP